MYISLYGKEKDQILFFEISIHQMQMEINSSNANGNQFLLQRERNWKIFSKVTDQPQVPIFSGFPT